MKHFVTAAILSICLSLQAHALIQTEKNGDFENWYFEFFTGTTKTTTELYTPEGKLLDRIHTQDTASIDKDKKIYTSEALVRSEVIQKNDSATSTLRPDGKNRYTGQGQSTLNGMHFKEKYELTLLANKNFRMKVFESDGTQKLIIDGYMTEDGKVYCQSQFSGPDGGIYTTKTVCVKAIPTSPPTSTK